MDRAIRNELVGIYNALGDDTSRNIYKHRLLYSFFGAYEGIREQRPRLAISVYHKPEDIWEIPSLILQYHLDYRLYLRHYSVYHAEIINCRCGRLGRASGI